MRYIVSQGWRLLWGSRLQTVLLTLCYAAGILIPMTILSYRQSVINGIENPLYIHDYNLIVTSFPDDSTAETFQKLTDYREIGALLATIGEGTQMAFSSLEGLETAVMLDGKVLRGSVAWRLPADKGGLVYDVSTTVYSYTGQPLSPDAPYQVMVGDQLLKGWGDLASLIGKELTLYGETYTVCGIIHGGGNIEGNLLSRGYAKKPAFGFRVPEKSAETFRRLSDELEERFSLFGLAEPKASESFIVSAEESIGRMLIIGLLGFAFCVFNSFGIIHSFLLDNRQKVYVKLTMGARRLDIFTELMVFWCLIALVGSLLAFGAFFGARAYMAMIFSEELALGWQIAVLLPLAGLATATLTSLYSVYRISRRLR